MRCDDRGSLFRYDPACSFWNFAAVGNYAARFYKYAMVDVREAQLRLQEETAALAASVDMAAARALTSASALPAPAASASVATTSAAASGQAEAAVADMLTKFMEERSNTIMSVWRDLLPQVITR